jgi:hypothetical protein
VLARVGESDGNSSPELREASSYRARIVTVLERMSSAVTETRHVDRGLACRDHVKVPSTDTGVSRPGVVDTHGRRHSRLDRNQEPYEHGSSDSPRLRGLRVRESTPRAESDKWFPSPNHGHGLRVLS